MKDKDLDGFLHSLRSAEPVTGSVERWKSAVNAELMRAPARRSSRWLELGAAVAVGILIGAFAFKSRESAQENYASDATIEYVVTKSH